MKKNLFAENLKRLRKHQGFTQDSFAEATSLKRTTITFYETGRRECDFDTLLLFSDVLGCTVDDLLRNPGDIEVRKNEINECEEVGKIYILTNPSFEEYVKIGYADDVERRLQELNRSECVPYSFRVYATYSVTSRLSDKNVHSIIDRLNPDLRTVETVNGKKREREFYAMKPEEAYKILEAIAEMHGFTDRLELRIPTDAEKAEEQEAQDIEKEIKSRSSNFMFSEWQIPVGATLQYYKDPSITCTVFDDRRVEYDGEIMYLTGAARKILGKDIGICGPRYFRYKGAKLWDIEGRSQS